MGSRTRCIARPSGRGNRDFEVVARARASRAARRRAACWRRPSPRSAAAGRGRRWSLPGGHCVDSGVRSRPSSVSSPWTTCERREHEQSIFQFKKKCAVGTAACCDKNMARSTGTSNRRHRNRAAATQSRKLMMLDGMAGHRPVVVATMRVLMRRRGPKRVAVDRT